MQVRKSRTGANVNGGRKRGKMVAGRLMCENEKPVTMHTGGCILTQEVLQY